MTCSDDSTPAGSPKEFSRHLRSRAREAAAASVEHAELSEQYLELSTKFAALAGQAASSESLAELRKELEAIEKTRLSSVAEVQDRDGRSGTDSDSLSGLESSRPMYQQDVSGIPRQDRMADDDRPPPNITPSSDPTDTEPAITLEAAGVAAPRAKRCPKRRRRLNARRFAERVRSAKHAVTRRVLVRAKKEALQISQRRALEELQKSRGSILTSVVCIAMTLFVLSLITMQLDLEIPIDPIMASFADEPTAIEEPMPIEPPEEEQGEQQEQETAESVEVEQEDPEPMEEEPAYEPEIVDAPEPKTEAGEMPAASDSAADLAAIDNRSEAGKKLLLEQFGGSAASESAVQNGLEWLISVQLPDGSWNFPHVGQAGNPGTINNPIGGTAYALLPFLAAGQTHRDGRFKKQVEAGLNYLTVVGIHVPAGYDLRGVLNKGNRDEEPNEAYYVHGAATLVLCEVYGMTKDRRLRMSAEAAVKFLVNSQDPRGGGWRYLPQQPGSTSVTVLQLMALMAAEKAGIKAPKRTLDGIMHYLDSVQIDGEGRYGYEVEKKTYRGSATAMALLSRMYLGWERNDGDLRAGVALLDRSGPYDNLYTTYFATQVMCNWGGSEWQRWNERVRDDLIAQQETQGSARGSWKPRTRAIHAKQGGRLLTTSLATLTLEVYYRYRPLLPERADDESNVPLDN